jgi:hypothetical protein
MAYLPSIRTMTVDMSKLAGPTVARWYDPNNGDYIAANSSPYANAGNRQFSPPGNNSSGDSDWVVARQSGWGDSHPDCRAALGADS